MAEETSRNHVQAIILAQQSSPLHPEASKKASARLTNGSHQRNSESVGDEHEAHDAAYG